MNCPKCGRAMTIGAGHADGVVSQWECRPCNVFIPRCFAMTLNKVAEAVQLFGPVLYHVNPFRR